MSLGKDYSDRRSQLQSRIDLAIESYGVRVLDNIDLSRLDTVDEKARVLGRALMARGDAKAFVLGRQLLELAEES